MLFAIGSLLFELKCFFTSYAQLGLVVTLDPSASGGIEKQLGLDSAAMDTSHDQEPIASSSTAQANVPVGFGRIKRNADGNILGFDLNESEQEPVPKPHDLEEELEARMDPDVRQKWSTNFSTSTASHFGPRNENLVKSEYFPYFLFFFPTSVVISPAIKLVDFCRNAMIDCCASFTSLCYQCTRFRRFEKRTHSHIAIFPS